MATAGSDARVNIWDLRMLKQVQSYTSHAPASCLDISQRGLLAVAYGRNVEVPTPLFPMFWLPGPGLAHAYDD